MGQFYCIDINASLENPFPHSVTEISTKAICYSNIHIKRSCPRRGMQSTITDNIHFFITCSPYRLCNIKFRHLRGSESSIHLQPDCFTCLAWLHASTNKCCMRNFASLDSILNMGLV